MRIFTVMMILIIALLGCQGDMGADPTLLSGGFKGISYMNLEGERAGPQDDSDWLTGKPTDVPCHAPGSIVIVPCSVEVQAAFPNPSDGNFLIVFAQPSHATYSFTLIDRDRRVIETIHGEARAGRNAIRFKNHPPTGIYRVVFEVDGVEGKGDVWIIR